MKKSYINLKLDDFKRRFSTYNLHRKKITALENMRTCFSFRHNDYLALIKKIMGDGFLDKEAETFLDYLIRKYEEENNVDYLLWTHKTQSLKRQMESFGVQKVKRDQQLYFNWQEIPKIKVGEYPIELIAAQKSNRARI